MRLVKKPLPYPPHGCAVTGRDDGTLVDFEVEVICVEPPHLYIKREVVENAAKLLGMTSTEEVEELRRQLKELGDKLDETLDTLAVAADFEQSQQNLTERIAA
jgi:hypothetical protein